MNSRSADVRAEPEPRGGAPGGVDGPDGVRAVESPASWSGGRPRRSRRIGRPSRHRVGPVFWLRRWCWAVTVGWATAAACATAAPTSARARATGAASSSARRSGGAWTCATAEHGAHGTEVGGGRANLGQLERRAVGENKHAVRIYLGAAANEVSPADSPRRVPIVHY
jgi:hypothetical protein